MMTLNKDKLDLIVCTPEEHPQLYCTTNYFMQVGDSNIGYNIFNADTGAIEYYTEQLPGAIFALLSMQEAYDEIMSDPVREYKAKKAQQSFARKQGGQRIVN